MKKLTTILITVFGLFTMLNASNYPVPSAYRAAMLSKKIDSKKWAEYDTILLSKLVGKHSNANCNPFGKLRFFRKNNHAILFPRRRKIRPEPKVAPKAKLTSGLSIHYSGGSSLSKDVEKWLKKCGASQKIT